MTVLLSIRPAPDAPIACDMRTASETLEERLAEYRRLFEHALIGRSSSSSATTFRFAVRPGVAEWVCDLARREAACCAFLSYEVVAEGDEILWTTSGGLGASEMAAIDEVLADVTASSGEIARRLGAGGVQVLE